MDSPLPTNSMRPAAAIIGHAAGDWRLDRLPKSQTVFLALALSAGVHAAFLLAFNQPAARIIPAILQPKTVMVEWHPADEPEPPSATSEVRELDEPPPVNIPKLPDAPTRVDLAPEFIVPLEPPAPSPEINAEKVTKIPTNTATQTLPPGGTFYPKQLDRAPQVIAQPAPRFPHELQNEVVSAELVVDFIVDTSGSVRGATIVSSTHPGFDRAALEGVRQWKFQPGIKDGRKVNTRIRQPLRFTLEVTPGN